MPGDMDQDVLRFSNKALQVQFKASKITLSVLHNLLKNIISKITSASYTAQHTGKQSLENLQSKGKALDHVQISNEDVKAFERELKKYNIDFSLMKEDGDKYSAFFKGQDTAIIHKALEDCLRNLENEAPQDTLNEELTSELPDINDLTEDNATQDNVVDDTVKDIPDIANEKDNISDTKDPELKKEKVKDKLKDKKPTKEVLDDATKKADEKNAALAEQKKAAPNHKKAKGVEL